MGKVLFFLAFILSLLLAVQGLAAEKVTFATHIRSNPHFLLPPLAAKEKGYWQEEGLEVNWVTFTSATSMQRAVAAGSVEMGTDGVIGLIRGASAGLPVVAVAQPLSDTFYFWVLTTSRIKGSQDLKGARVVVDRFGATIDALSRVTLAALGLEKDAKMISGGGTPERNAALKAGVVDISSGTLFTMLPLLVKEEVRAVVKLNDYAPEGIGAEVIYSRRDTLQKSLEAVKKTVKGFLRGAELVMADKDWALAKMKGEVRYDETAARIAYPELKYDLKAAINPSVFQTALDFLIKYKLVAREKVPPLDRLYMRGLTP